MMRFDAATDPRPARRALAPDGGSETYGSSAVPATRAAGEIRITPSRQIVDRRDPSVSFKVSAEGFVAFDVLLTTDPVLFDSRSADRRTPANFRSSRQDFSGESIPTEIGFYMTPTAFLGALVAVVPRPERLYYVAVGYRDDNRTSGAFSSPAEMLANMAPYVQLAANLGSASLSTVLGTAVERLGQAGSNHRTSAARPLSQVGMPRRSIGGLPVHGSHDGSRRMNGGSPSEHPVPTGPARGTADPTPGNRQPQRDSALPGKDAAKAPPSALRPVAGNGAAVKPEPRQNTDQTATNGALVNGGYIDEDADYGVADSPQSGRGYRDLDASPREPDQAQRRADDYDDGFGPGPAAEPMPDGSDPGQTGIAPDDYVGGTGAAPPSNNGLGIPALDPGPGPAPGDLGQARPESAAQGLGERPSPPFARLHRSLERNEPNSSTKLKTVDAIAQFEGAGRYDALNLDGEFRGRFGADNPFYNRAHVGLSYGLVQFTQDSGALGELLALMRDKDPERFADDDMFGASADQLIAVTTASGPGSLDVEGGRSARVQPVDGGDLWEEPWIARFRNAAQHEPFREAQRELAISRYLDPILPYVRWLGLWTERGLAMLYDRSVQQGASGGMRFVVDAVGPVDTTAKRTLALDALGYETLEDFQRGVAISEDGDWGKQTHAAMIGALRGLAAESPVQLPDYSESLDLIVAAAGSRPFAHRVTNLRSAQELSDQPLTE